MEGNLGRSEKRNRRHWALISTIRDGELLHDIIGKVDHLVPLFITTLCLDRYLRCSVMNAKKSYPAKGEISFKISSCGWDIDWFNQLFCVLRSYATPLQVCVASSNTYNHRSRVKLTQQQRFLTLNVTPTVSQFISALVQSNSLGFRSCGVSAPAARLSPSGQRHRTAPYMPIWLLSPTKTVPSWHRRRRGRNAATGLQMVNTRPWMEYALTDHGSLKGCGGSRSYLVSWPVQSYLPNTC